MRFFLVFIFFSNLLLSLNFKEKELIRILEKENNIVYDYLRKNKKYRTKFKKNLKKYKLISKTKPYLLRGKYNYKLSNDGKFGLIKRQNSKTLKEEVLFDINKLALSHSFYKFGFFSVSNNHKYLAFTDDKEGKGNYTLNIYDISKKELLQSKMKNISKEIFWDILNENVYFLENDKYTFLPKALGKWNIKTLKKEIIYESNNFDFVMSLYKTSNPKYAILSFNDNNSSFQKIINLTNDKLIEVKKYKKGIEYYIDILNDKVFIYSNINAKFSIYKTNINNFELKTWQEVYSPSKEKIDKWYLFENFLALQLSNGSKTFLRVINFNGKVLKNKFLNNELNTSWLSRNDYSNTTKINFRTQSLIQPASWTNYDVLNDKYEKKLIDKYSNYRKNDYVTKEIFVKNKDIDIPVSIAYKKDKLNKKSPILLYVYGAYNENVKRYFMPEIISLLDQGFIYAIAHVRGGNFLGKQWAQKGIGKNRINSINDYIQVAKYFRTFDNSKNRNIIAYGSSAGALIVASAINKKPSLFKASLLKVPFLSVLKSLKNEKLLYKNIEFEQWGNPNKKDELEIIKKYDPFLNIKKQNYPKTLIVSSYKDTRVSYKEAFKYFEKLKKNTLFSKEHLFFTNFDAGHQGNLKNSFYEKLLDYTFILSEGKK